MSIALKKADIEERSQLVSDLREAWENVTNALDTFNKAVEELRGPVTEAIEKYNNVVAGARSWAEDIANAAQDEWDGKSEGWQESDKGEGAAQFISEYESISLDDIEITWNDDATMDKPDHADDLEGLPTEPD